MRSTLFPMSFPATQSAVVYTSETDSAEAGKALGAQISAALAGLPAHAVMLFVSPRYDASVLSAALMKACHPELVVGCSSAGEFTNKMRQGEGQACAIAIRSSEMLFAAALSRNLSADRAAAARGVMAAFRGVDSANGDYCSALILTDALAGHADDLIEHLTLCTGGNHQFFGGGAGDDARFEQTQVIFGSEVSSDAVVALEILSKKPVGVGVRHGWRPVGVPLRVTEAKGSQIISLNATRASAIFAQHAAATGQEFNPQEPIPFFLHNILGIETPQGFKLRVPLAINADGSVTCAAEIPEGAVVHLMSTDIESARTAAAEATRDALNNMQGSQPQVALFFDCVATRLRMGKAFDYELEALREVLGEIEYGGCNTYGQVARAEGQFSGFHNCTAVVCILPA
ncbi:MAG: hypothetical protein JWR15_3529 [Prosthecobacter sp.]|nr:hypothetical protein [Prosthecobacter sp.]